YEHQDRVTRRHGLSHASIYPYGPFGCADGTVMIAVQTNAEFARLCDIALGRPDLAGKTAFATNANRVANRIQLDAELEPVFAAMPVTEAVARLTAAGIAFGRYCEVSDLSRHPALRRVSTALPDGVTVEVPRPPGRGDDFSASAVPELGQHTEAIRSEFGL
ncbi:MAG: CoA transferase, partial [Pseudomonadota bacterium]